MASGPRQKNILKLTVALLFLPLAGCTMFRQFELSQVYHPSRTPDHPPETVGRPFEEVWFAASDGTRLRGWFFSAETNSTRAGLAVLFCPGNGGNITSRPGYYRAILETGVNLLTFDYRGYGRSEGRPGEAGTYLDAQAAHGWLRQKGFVATNIIAWGESLGGGIASGLAEREPLGGLVLQCSFTSVPDLGAEIFPWLPVRLLGSIHYDTRARLPRLDCPVLVMHSRTDTTIPFAHAERNFAAAREPKLFWELRGDHNTTLEADRDRYVQGGEKFFQLIETRRACPAPGR